MSYFLSCVTRPVMRWQRGSTHWLAGVGIAAIGLATAPAHATCLAVGLVTCSVTTSATLLPFGNYDPNRVTASDISSIITVTGTAVGGVGLVTTIGYSISLSQGLNGNVGERKMIGGSAATPLGYNLFTNSSYDQVWGTDSVSDSFTVLVVLGGTSLTQSYRVYGRIPPNQYVSVGAYADTITVTVNY